jgi:hypothetical protein
MDKIFGAIARFKYCSTVFHAAEKVRDAGFKKWDVYTPFPIHGLDAAMGLKRSKVPFFTFFGGVTGITIATLMVWYMNCFDYPLIVGGKPYFSPIFPFPVMYELTILLASFGTFFGMFITNRLPRHHYPLFDVPGFEKVSDDEFFIFIQSADSNFNSDKTMDLLKSVGGQDVTLVKR